MEDHEIFLQPIMKIIQVLNNTCYNKINYMHSTLLHLYMMLFAYNILVISNYMGCGDNCIIISDMESIYRWTLNIVIRSFELPQCINLCLNVVKELFKL